MAGRRAACGSSLIAVVSDRAVRRVCARDVVLPALYTYWRSDRVSIRSPTARGGGEVHDGHRPRRVAWSAPDTWASGRHRRGSGFITPPRRRCGTMGYGRVGTRRKACVSVRHRRAPNGGTEGRSPGSFRCALPHPRPVVEILSVLAVRAAGRTGCASPSKADGDTAAPPAAEAGQGACRRGPIRQRLTGGTPPAQGAADRRRVSAYPSARRGSSPARRNATSPCTRVSSLARTAVFRRELEEIASAARPGSGVPGSRSELGTNPLAAGKLTRRVAALIDHDVTCACPPGC